MKLFKNLIRSWIKNGRSRNGGIRTEEQSYNRLAAIGDRNWEGYEVTVLGCIIEKSYTKNRMCI